MVDHEIILDYRASFSHFCVKRKNEGKATRFSIGRDSTTLFSCQREDVWKGYTHIKVIREKEDNGLRTQ